MSNFNEVAPRTLRVCLDLIIEHHGHQKYGGRPYFLHPIEVAENLEGYGANETQVLGALLHDTLEDTDLTEDQIQDFFGYRVLEVVQLLTKSDGEEYNDYIQRLVESGNYDALVVKKSDLEVNLRNGPKKKNVDKYQAALEQVNQALAQFEDGFTV